jgi:acyl-CoA hydrolase
MRQQAGSKNDAVMRVSVKYIAIPDVRQQIISFSCKKNFETVVDIMQGLQGKPVRDSMVERVEMVLPNDANPLGNMLGGRVMHLIDITAAIAAHRHSRSIVVTASIDEVDFHHPIKVGQLIVLKAAVNHTGRTSMEVGVKVFSEDTMTGARVHTSSAYLTFVALDPEGHPRPVPPVIPETEEEQRRYREAAHRRARRLERMQAYKPPKA